MSTGGQFLNDVGPDKSRTAGHQRYHLFLLTTKGLQNELSTNQQPLPGKPGRDRLPTKHYRFLSRVCAAVVNTVNRIHHYWSEPIAYAPGTYYLDLVSLFV